MNRITTEQLTELYQCPESRAERYFSALNDAMEAGEINTLERVTAFLAQVGHESGRLRYVAEIASGDAYDDRDDLGNTKPEAVSIAAANGSTPGPWWKGHGLIQITGYDNHFKCGEALGLDLLNDPELLMVPEHAADSAVWFWLTKKLNALADAGAFEQITRRINGGLNGLTDRMMLWERAKDILG